MRAKLRLSDEMLNKVKASMRNLYLSGHIIDGMIAKVPNVFAPWSNSSSVLSRREAELFRKFIELAGDIAHYDHNTQWTIDESITDFGEFVNTVDNAYAVIGRITL